MTTACPNCRNTVKFALDALPSEATCGVCGHHVSPAVTSGLTIGGYQLKAAIGKGGMARVFRAEQGNLKREVAVKILHHQHRGDAERVAQFMEEAQTAARLNHPGIVQVFDLGQDGGVYYFAMELVRGASVKEILANGCCGIDWSLAVTEKVAKALRYAWEQGNLVHRDIKPDNIMIRQDGTVKLTDFGLAASAHEIKDGGVIEGSPHYISPEPIVGQPVDFRSDVYSLGATLYHMVTGTLPFTGDSPVTTAWLQAHGDLESPSSRNPQISEAVSQLICRMMAKNPDDRFASYDELVSELKRVRATLTVKVARRPRRRDRIRRSAQPAARLHRRLASFAAVSAVICALIASAMGIRKPQVASPPATGVGANGASAVANAAQPKPLS